MLDSRSKLLFFTLRVSASQGMACGGSLRSGPDERTAAGSSSANGGSSSGGSKVSEGGAGLPASNGGSRTAGGSAPADGGSAAATATGGAAGNTASTSAGAGGAEGEGEGPTRIILFDGSNDGFQRWAPVKDLHGANPWTNNNDGTMTVKSSTGDIQSKQTFRDVFVHLEYKTPNVPLQGDERSLGNSGVVLNGSYELQILNDYGSPPTIYTCGAVNGYLAPLAVACREPEEWNSYDIEFQAPDCDEEAKITSPARFLQVKLNGTLIHDNVVVSQSTVGTRDESCEPTGLLLQDQHSIGNVSFRNIWAIARD